MKRKWILRIIIFLIAGFLVAGIAFLLKDDNSEQLKDSDLEQLMDADLEDLNSDDTQINTEGTTINGTIVRVYDTSLLVNDSPYPYRTSLCELPITDDTIIYVDGEESDITKLKLGQTVEATYSGGMLERYPSVAFGVTKIHATTENVLQLDGTIIGVDKKTLQIQYGNDDENIFTMSISKETLVCMHGLDYGIGSLEVGQNVEVAYTEEEEDALPRATVILVK